MSGGPQPAPRSSRNLIVRYSAARPENGFSSESADFAERADGFFPSAIGSSEGLASRLETDPAVGPEFGTILVQLLSRQNITFRAVRFTVERTEIADRGTDIGVVDIAIDDVGDDIFRMQAAADG